MPSALEAKTSAFGVVQPLELDHTPDSARQEYSAVSVCPHCYGTGMEVIPGKGARRCECRKIEDRAKLLQ